MYLYDKYKSKNPSFAASEFREPGSRLPDLRNLGVLFTHLDSGQFDGADRRYLACKHP